jgi:subtilisin family serine protease
MTKALLVIMMLVFVSSFAFGEAGVIRRSGKRVSGQYIVVFDSKKTPSAAAAASELGRQHAVKTKWVYDTVFRGFSFSGSEAAALAISNDPRVLWVQEDSVVIADATVNQSPAPSWGLDRLDQAFSLTLGDNRYTASYTGVGTVIYVIDSGVTPVFSEFGSRIREAHNWAPGPNGQVDPNDTGDCYGHGTRVASLAAGATYGVAKDAAIVNLRVTDCNGAYSSSTSTVIAAINWMIADHANNHPSEPAVANMSLGSAFGPDSALDAAAVNAVLSGITVVVSAGNQQLDACSRSPARVGNPNSYPQGNGASVITVAAVDSNESFSGWYSNYGTCVDILAPATYLTTMTSSGNSDSTWYGTSFGAPLVSGVAAMHMERFPTIANNPGSIEGLIKDNANQNQIANVPVNTPNLLIFNYVATRRHACCS